MAWLKEVIRALKAGREIRVPTTQLRCIRTMGFATITPTAAAEVSVGDLVFAGWKTGFLVAEVTETDQARFQLGWDRREEPRWVHGDAIRGKVTKIEKHYDLIDPENPEIRYDSLHTGGPPTTASGDYRNCTFALYAKYDFWEFQLTPAGKYSADELILSGGWDDESTDLIRRSFQISSEYGIPGKSAASYVPDSEVLRLIRHCIEQYELHSRAPEPPLPSDGLPN